MAHGDAREGKWSGSWPMEWVASTLHTTSEQGVSSITTADAHTSAASSRVKWRPPPTDLNGLVRFAERRILVSARVPSHFKRSRHTCNVTAYRNTVSWQCGRESWPRNVSKVGYEVMLRAFFGVLSVFGRIILLMRRPNTDSTPIKARNVTS